MVPQLYSWDKTESIQNVHADPAVRIQILDSWDMWVERKDFSVCEQDA